MIKKYIKGNNERGSEVIKALEDLGGENKNFLEGISETTIYVIGENNIIRGYSMVDDPHITAIITEFFEEITLPEKDKIDEIIEAVIEKYDYDGFGYRGNWSATVRMINAFNQQPGCWDIKRIEDDVKKDVRKSLRDAYERMIRNNETLGVDRYRFFRCTCEKLDDNNLEFTIEFVPIKSTYLTNLKQKTEKI